MEFIKRDKAWLSVAREVYRIQKKRKELQELEAKLLTQLKDLSEFKNSEFGDMRFQRVDRAAPVRYSEIPELKNIDLDLYRTGEPVVSWKLFKY